MNGRGEQGFHWAKDIPWKQILGGGCLYAILIAGVYCLVQFFSNPLLALLLICAGLLLSLGFGVVAAIRGLSSKAIAVWFLEGTVAFIVSFAVIYNDLQWISGGSDDPPVTCECCLPPQEDQEEARKEERSFKEHLYFSVVTWTTVGFGDYTPVPEAQLYVAIESLLGYIYMAISMGVLTASFLGSAEHLHRKKVENLLGVLVANAGNDAGAGGEGNGANG